MLRELMPIGITITIIMLCLIESEVTITITIIQPMSYAVSNDVCCIVTAVLLYSIFQKLSEV